MIFKQLRGPLGEEGLLRFMGFHTKQKFSGSRGLLGKGMLRLLWDGRGQGEVSLGFGGSTFKAPF